MEREVRWAKQILHTQFSPEKIEEALQDGFSLVQLSVATVLDGRKINWKKYGNVFEVFDSPLPKDVRVTERGFNVYTWTEYMNTALSRLAEIGCQTLVWADGKARLLPVEGETAVLKEQFYQFLFILGGIAERFGITLCLEPLSPKRTNFLNSFLEVMECIERVEKKNIALSVGLRTLHEIATTKESTYEPLLEYKDRIAHVHVEHPNYAFQSMAPRPTDGVEYGKFFSALKKGGYQGVITLPPDANAESLSYCRKAWEQES
ncbi:MAG: sugar phosphate isomerase/epimerase [Spirochaetes bacterium]|nr:sugar phosphate isomerase/epimerase [Spirochaetota bacterium]